MDMSAKTYKLFDKKYISSFENLFADYDELETLPLTHKQDWYSASEILQEGKIKVTPCDVFENENLIYYFYGKPSYVVSEKIGSRGDNVYFPVCFVIRFESVNFEKVFPFDSGAFAEKMFDGFFHKKMNLHQFSLKPNIHQIKGLIKTFFGNNNNYYRSVPVVRYEDFKNDEVKAYVNLLNNKGEESFDERNSSIEIISKSDLPLKDNIIAIILPSDIAETDKSIENLRKQGVEIITYDTFGGNPGAYNSVIRQYLYDFLKNKGAFKLK